MGSHRESVALHPQGHAHRQSQAQDLAQSLAQSLAEGLEQIGLATDESVRGALLAYLALLSKWNQVYNLTAIRDPRDMLVQHLLDSLAVVPSLKRHWGATMTRPPDLADIGSGGGLPAIPIALVWPQARYTLVESVSKKAAFLRQALGTLGLTDRVRVVGQRVQSLKISAPFDLITCRAYATLADFASDVQAIAGEQTRLVALKGLRPDSEIEGILSPWLVDEVEVIAVPFSDAQRHLVWLRHE